MQTVKCSHCGKVFAITYKHCPFCNAPSPIKQTNRKGGKRLAGKQQKPVPKLSPERTNQNTSPAPDSQSVSNNPSPRVTPTSSPEPDQTYAPPKRSSFLRRFFIFCSIILILAAIFIVASIVKTLFGDKGTPAPAEPSAITEVSPSPSVNSDTLTGISISPAQVHLESPQDTLQLSITPEPATAQIEEVSWSSQNPAIATIDENGLIKAVDTGNTTITATCGEWTATCTVTVGTITSSTPSDDANASHSNEPSLSRTDFTLASAGDSYQIQVSGTTSSVTWSIEDPSIATVSESGVVTAVSRGKTIVTATIDGKTLECIVRVR